MYRDRPTPEHMAHDAGRACDVGTNKLDSNTARCNDHGALGDEELLQTAEMRGMQ